MTSKRLQNRIDLRYNHGNNQRGAKGDEAPPLAESKLRKEIEYRIVLIFFVSQWFEFMRFG